MNSLQFLNLKKLKWFIIIFIILTFTFIWFKYGFFIVTCLFTPKQDKLSPDEVNLFNEIKVEFSAQQVYREIKPKGAYGLEPMPYQIIISGIQCQNFTNDSLYKIAYSIVERADSIFSQEKRFSSYEVIFICNDSSDSRFKEFLFSREQYQQNKND